VLCAGVSAVVFLIGQLLAWRQLIAAGYVVAGNPANSFFYLVTAIHGLHLLGGLVALGRTIVKLWRGADLPKLRLSVELCTTGGATASSLSSLVTRTTSPSFSDAISLANCGRSARAPLIFSR
jgi:hypothetical protein